MTLVTLKLLKPTGKTHVNKYDHLKKQLATKLGIKIDIQSTKNYHDLEENTTKPCTTAQNILLEITVKTRNIRRTLRGYTLSNKQYSYFI